MKDRPKLFKIALANAGISARKWSKMHGVAISSVSGTCHGKITSRRLLSVIDAFIADEFKRLPKINSRRSQNKIESQVS